MGRSRAANVNAILARIVAAMPPSVRTRIDEWERGGEPTLAILEERMPAESIALNLVFRKKPTGEVTGTITMRGPRPWSVKADDIANRAGITFRGSLPETLTQSMVGRDAGDALGHSILTGTTIVTAEARVSVPLSGGAAFDTLAITVETDPEKIACECKARSGECSRPEQ